MSSKSVQDNFEKINTSDLKVKDLPELERYILHKVYVLDKIYKENLKHYNLHKLYKELLNFCTLDLSSFYFDIRKDVLYCEGQKSKKRKDCILVLNVILDCLLKWFAPILVFTTEEIFTLVSKTSKSIHELDLPKINESFKNSEIDELKGIITDKISLISGSIFG